MKPLTLNAPAGETVVVTLPDPTTASRRVMWSDDPDGGKLPVHDLPHVHRLLDTTGNSRRCTFPEALTGRASPAKAAVGDNTVFADIASLPQLGIAEAVDTLAAKTLPNLRRSVKWGMAYYGVGDGWCFSCGGFVGHVKLMFINGATLDPVPPVTPVGMGKSTPGVELESADDLDKRQIASSMTQVTSVPGIGGKKR